MRKEPLLAELGHFVFVFQAIEAAVTDLIEFVIDADPEYVHALAAELEYSAKVRALDVIFARYAQIHGLATEVPHPDFHKLMSKLLRLAERRNEIVHSFYNLLITVDGTLALMRRPTKLRPSKGERHDPPEDILPGALAAETGSMQEYLQELEKYRTVVLDARYPPEK